MSRIIAHYRLRCPAAEVQARARAIAVEQSVEMPLEGIRAARVLAEIVGEVRAIEPLGEEQFRVSIGLASETVGGDPAQLLNMLFGNVSLLDWVTLEDATLPDELLAAFAGPRHGIAGLRARVGAPRRALACSALKPQGLPPAELADLAQELALGGLDYLKDDHGLADQAYSPFARRVPAIAHAVARASQLSGQPTAYVPSLSGSLDVMRQQVRIAREEGLTTLLIAPLTAGVATLAQLSSEHPEMAFLAHPSLGGAARLAPPLLFGRLFRLFGADATIFPNHGGRFGYSATTCRAVAQAARAPWAAVRPCLPVPAGGMTRARVTEMLEFYGPDCMLLIGGNLLAAAEGPRAAAAAFVAGLRAYRFQAASATLPAEPLP
ncbi:MAG: ribulose 1,5-bisphosphate carboxylase [Alphaproteobacteria bacterium]|nr:ribulose 1,5-bisphosphate carboxylase [Alphaproteobacteria bacterium]